MKSAAPDTAFRWQTGLAGLLAMAVAQGLGRFGYTPILPWMMAGLGLSASEAGWIAGANYLGYFLGAVAAGASVRPGGERLVAVGAVAATALLLAAMAAAESVPAFLAIRFVSGATSAFVMVFATTIVLGSTVPESFARTRALHFAGVGLGIAVSAIVVPAVSAATGGWRGGWLAIGSIGLLAFLAVAAMLPRAEGASRQAIAEPPLSWSRPFLAILFAYGMFGFGYVITATFLVAIVRSGAGGPWLETAAWLVTGLVALPSVVFWQPVVARIGLRASYAIGCLVLAAGVLSSVTLAPPAGPLVGGALLGATVVMLTAYGFDIARKLCEASPRRAVAYMTAAFGLGQIAGPVAGGYLADWSGSFMLPSLMAAGALAAGAAVVRVWGR